MKTIKFSKDKHKIYLDGVEYKGYTIGNLPNSFGFKAFDLGQNENGNTEYKKGKSKWFNYKGLTFIEAPAKW